MKDFVITVISNVVFEPFFQSLIRKEFSEIDKKIIIRYINYHEILRYNNCDLSEQTELLLIWINFEHEYEIYFKVDSQDYSNIIDEIQNQISFKIDYILPQFSCKKFFISFEDYYMKQKYFFGNTFLFKNSINILNQSLFEKYNSILTFIDFEKIIAETGISKSYSFDNNYRWNSPYSKALIQNISKEIKKQYLIQHRISKKCLVLDCDNVLWKGILSDDGIGGIELGNIGEGKKYKDFQKIVLNLYFHGIILALCSKNNYEDVLRVFREHEEMVLKEQHISCFMVNWNNKVENIKNISEMLNIDLNSIVFVDDSYFEVNLVREYLPEVDSYVFSPQKIYESLNCFNLVEKVDSKNVEVRTNTYRTNVQRNELKKSLNNIEKFLEKLKTKIDIHIAKFEELNRISELSLRTNKYTNGKRYCFEDLKRMISCEEYSLYSVYVSDIFSDFGLVGAIGIKHNKLDLVCLSCRVLGRSIENSIMEFILTLGLKDFYFVSTNKNDVVLDDLTENIPYK